MADNTEKIAEFISVTGVDENRAKFYLQSANWELHIALGTFYDADSGDVANPDDGDFAMDEDPSPPPQKKESSSSSKTKEGGAKSGGRFATIANYQKDDSSDEEGQAFYAGGSESSGQQIIGPDKKKKNPTQALFEAAKEHGAEVVSEDSSHSKKSNKQPVFQGAGFKLGSDVEPSQQVSASLREEDRPREPTNVKIRFWKDGFSVDNGPLRAFNDPANKEFLDAIKRGEVPAELRRQAQNGEVHVDMEDHREEEFVKPKESLKSFSGAGHKLGSPTPGIVQEETVEVPATASRVPQQPTFKVDETKPVTTIQIRLADGTRLVSKFNHHNTIGDIRSLVRSAKPTGGNFNLMTTFPNKVLNDDTVTITDAKLLNAVIVQRMI